MGRVKTYQDTVDVDKIIARLRAEVDALKLTNQQIGASNLVILEKYNGTEFGDYDIVNRSIGIMGEVGWGVTFRYNSAKKPLSDLFINWSVSGVSQSSIQLDVIPDPVNTDITNYKSWLVRAINWSSSAPAIVSLKAYVRCQDTGELEVEEIYSI